MLVPCKGRPPANVRFGSKADIEAPQPDVRFTPKSRHHLSAVGCPLCAKSGHPAFIRLLEEEIEAVSGSVLAQKAERK